MSSVLNGVLTDASANSRHWLLGVALSGSTIASSSGYVMLCSRFPVNGNRVREKTHQD